MKERLLIVRKEKLTVAQLDELKASDNVGDIRSVLGFLILVVNSKFETKLEFIDVQQIFEVIVDGQMKIDADNIDPEVVHKFMKDMGAYLTIPSKQNVVNLVRSDAATPKEE